MRLDLRPVGQGETRILGRFISIDCRDGLFLLQIDANGRTLRLAAKQLSDVDFISYRTETPGSVSCGPLSAAARALATYRFRSETTGAGSIDGDAVAIELIPDDYTPEPVR